MTRIHVVAATAAALVISLQTTSMARAETLTLSFSAFSGSANGVTTCVGEHPRSNV